MTATAAATRWRARLAGTAGGFRGWLTDRGSLTARIRAGCTEFSVRPVRQALDRPFRDEFGCLGLRRGEISMIREVYLYCGERPVVFAHSAVARADLRGAWRSVVGLGTRPLGHALFSNPRVERAPLAFRRLTPRDRLFHRAVAALPAAPGELWARRSLFRLRGRPLLVTEVFLPALLEAVK
ncbi:MAG TPA: chorismate lyase [Pelomicrobium sp.]|nr:chorismate lyase [Pelomicrobium sp.]